MLPALAALAIAASLGLRLEEAGELPHEEASRLVAELGRDLESACARPVVIDDPVWSSCPGDQAPDVLSGAIHSRPGGRSTGLRPGQRCVDQIRERTRAEEVVLVRVLAGLTIARVIADRFAAGAIEPARTERDVPRDPSRWKEPLAELARAICPATAAPPPPRPPLPPPAVTDTAPRAAERNYLPWVVIGGSAVLAGAGLIFGISSADANDESQRVELAGDEFEALADRKVAHAITADVLFAAAGAGLITAIVLFASEP